MAYFVVTSEQGPSWTDSRPMRDQDLWTEHAAFINSAVDAGIILMGGPLGDGRPHRALLIVHSDSVSNVQTWLKEDPWIRAGILRTLSVESWKLLVTNDHLDPVLAEITKSSASP